LEADTQGAISACSWRQEIQPRPLAQLNCQKHHCVFKTQHAKQSKHARAQLLPSFFLGQKKKPAIYNAAVSGVCLAFLYRARPPQGCYCTTLPFLVLGQCQQPPRRQPQ
jgi:hypothetical protein